MGRQKNETEFRLRLPHEIASVLKEWAKDNDRSAHAQVLRVIRKAANRRRMKLQAKPTFPLST